MKNLALLFCLLPVVLFSQEEDRSTSLQDFFLNVHHVELCELKPAMVVDTIFDGNAEVADTTYYLETIVLENSIDLERIGYRCKDQGSAKQEIDSILLHHNSRFETVMSCYSPRNGILFYDESNQLIGYLEICFECLGHADYLISVDWLDDQQLEQLKDVFIREGLQVE